MVEEGVVDVGEVDDGAIVLEEDGVDEEEEDVELEVEEEAMTTEGVEAAELAELLAEEGAAGETEEEAGRSELKISTLQLPPQVDELSPLQAKSQPLDAGFSLAVLPQKHSWE